MDNRFVFRNSEALDSPLDCLLGFKSHDKCAEKSVSQLLTGLSSKLCENVHQQSSIARKKLVNKLRSRAYDTLLFKGHSRDIRSDQDEYLDDDLIASLVDVVYFRNLQNSTWTAQKNKKLVIVIDKISSLLKENPHLKPTLLFLLHLSGSNVDIGEDASQSDPPFHENVFNLDVRRNDPSKSLCTSYSKRFSPSLFEVDLGSKDKKTLKNRSSSLDSPLDGQPGSHLILFEKYSSVWYMQNKNNLKNSGNTIQKPNSLFIPELNLDVPRSLTVPSFRSLHLDEGYVTPDKEFIDNMSRRSSTSGFHDKKPSSSDVWNNMSVESLCKPLQWNWENLGEPVSEPEPPFLTQSDVTVFECWKKNRFGKEFAGEQSTDTPVAEKNIPISELFRDIKYLMIGVETKTFTFNQELKSFMIEPGTAVESLTSKALSIYIEEFLTCGNDVRLLTQLLKNSKENINFNKQGLVFEAMCSSLKTWLQAYRGMVVKIEEDSSILKLRTWLKPLRLQLHFLAKFCCPPSTRVLMDQCCPLPRGGELLTHIYNAAQMSAFPEISFVLYHFLESCLKVYYRFIENWLFEGSCEDQYGEFFIEPRNTLESSLDRSYWRKAFSLNQEKVPVFLSELAQKIFICGKSLNLVKLCAPNDALFKHLEISHPSMIPCLEESTLEQLANDYNEFVIVCKPDCGINPFQSPNSTASAEKEALFLMNAKLQREKSMDRIKAAQEEERKNIFEEKKKIFDILKSEMEEAERRKIETRRKQLAEEQQRLQEMAETDLQDAIRENDEKRRLIEYYKSISDLAENRKLKAKWKLQRLQLNEKRLLFLADDKKNISRELLTHKLADEVDNRRNSYIFKLDSYMFKLDIVTNDKDDEGRLPTNESSTTIDSNRLEEEGECPPTVVSEIEDWKTVFVSVSEAPSCDTVSSFMSVMSSKESESVSSSVGEKISSTSISESNTIETPVMSSTSLIEETSLDQEQQPIKMDYELVDEFSEEKSDSKKRFDSYNVAHSEARQNKMKVLEFEFDLKNSWLEDNKSHRNKLEVDNKERVVEMKLNTNNEIIRERTQELELACLRAADSRREAAQNKSKVMCSEYDIIKNEFNVKNIENRKRRIESHNRITSEQDGESEISASKEGESDDPDADSDSKVLNDDDDDEEDHDDNPSNFMSSEYFNSDGKFIFNEIPIVVDITDKKLRNNSKSKFHVHKIDLSAIHNCLYKSVSIPTDIQHVFANDAVLRLFFTNEKLLDHLQCIRKYFFLLDGEYGRILTGSLFRELELVEHPSVLLSRHRLNAILQMASNSFWTDSSMTDKLSFFVNEIPLAFLLTDPEVLKCLSMRYKLHWPLNIILSEDAILSYDKIFAFQLQLHRASWVLQQDTQILKIEGMLKSSQYRQLQIFRHTMNQFIRSFINYITTIALEDSWREFERNLVKVDTLDALYMAHVKYVKMVNFRCLLNNRSQPLQKQIYELLRAILTFHELLRNGEWVQDTTDGNHTHSAFPRLSHQFSVFLRVARFLVKYLKQLVCKGYQPHIDLLLTDLSGNNYYE